MLVGTPIPCMLVHPLQNLAVMLLLVQFQYRQVYGEEGRLISLRSPNVWHRSQGFFRIDRCLLYYLYNSSQMLLYFFGSIFSVFTMSTFIFCWRFCLRPKQTDFFMYSFFIILANKHTPSPSHGRWPRILCQCHHLYSAIADNNFLPSLLLFPLLYPASIRMSWTKNLTLLPVFNVLGLRIPSSYHCLIQPDESCVKMPKIMSPML